MYHIETHADRILLSGDTSQAEIYLFGALLNRYAILQQSGEWFNCVRGYDSPTQAEAEITKGFRSAKLSPFVCRMKNAAYEFAGKRYESHKHNRKGHALHGLLYDHRFALIASHSDSESAWIDLRTAYTADSNYPFDYELVVRYQLSAQGLSITTTAYNIGETDLPLADGWHPYFQLGGAVDTWQLQINSGEQLVFDEDLLPTGEIKSDERFISGASLSGISLDNSFVLADHHQAACRLENAKFLFSIYADKSYPYLQIYTPADRQSIAIENLSGAPDCFNNRLGLNILAPNSHICFNTRYLLLEK